MSSVAPSVAPSRSSTIVSGPEQSSSRFEPSHLKELAILSKGNNNAELESIPGENWMQKLRYAFLEADPKDSGCISFDRWMNSNLRWVVSPDRLTDEQFREFFRHVDSNSDQIISWNELVDYIMCQQRALMRNDFDKKLRLVPLGPDLATAHKYRRTTACLRAMYIHYLEEFGTLTQSALYFWNLKCQQVKQFTDGGNFVDFCYLKSQIRLAIAKENRSVIFYDLRTHTKLPFYVSATIETSLIPDLSFRESKQLIKKLKKEQAPLFHIPTAIECRPNQPFIYVGDQEGGVEVFEIAISKASRFTWEVTKIKSKRIHHNAITQMRYIEDLDGIVTSSDDGSIVVWKYDHQHREFMIECKFSEPEKLPITSFVYDNRTRTIVYTTASHHLGCWKVYSTERVLLEVPSVMISAMAAIQVSEEASFIVTVSDSNFFSTFIAPSLEQTGNWPMLYHHSKSIPTAAMVMGDNLYLVGSYISCWQCQSADSDGMKPHIAPLLSALANDAFGKIVSCDETGDILNWECATGNKSFHFTLTESDSTVTSMQSDSVNRRLVLGYSSGAIKLISTNSGSLLSSADKGTVDNGVNWVIFATMLSSKYIVAASGMKQLVVFEDTISEKLIFVKALLGHKEQISRVINLKDTYLLSMGMESELLLWNNKILNPAMKFELPHDPSCISDMPTADGFVVCDVIGNIYIMSIKEAHPLQAISFGMKGIVPITAVACTVVSPFMAVGNRLGYIKFYRIFKDNLEERSFFRAHPDAVEMLSVSEKFKFVVSCGRDDEIRIWYIEPYGYIGELGKHKKWRIEDRSTWAKNPLEIDSTHLKGAEEEEQSELDTTMASPSFCISDSSDSEIDADITASPIHAYRPMTTPGKFTIEEVGQILSEIDDIYSTGRDRQHIARKYDTLMRPTPKTEKERLMSMDDFIPTKELETVSKKLRVLRATKFQKKFKIPQKGKK